MKNIFNTIKIAVPKKNTFDLTHDVKLTGQMGNLIPIMNMECVPGDKITLGADTLIRFAPLIAPVMHRMDATIHYFFVPNRILWPNWEKFITNQETGGLPFITIDGTLSAEQTKFLDYMGIPPYTGPVDQQVNALPFTAYQKIYNDYYRDQNLITDESANLLLVDGDNNANRSILTTLRRRAWEHDYFTASLPFAQKGDQVDIPLGEITLKDNWNTVGTPEFVDVAGNQLTGAVSGTVTGIQTGATPGSLPSAYDPKGTLQTEATTINDLRRAFKLQEWLEKNARGGTRYIESILVHFGVRSSDKRLQRPEYITGTKSPIVISEVLNTTGEDGGLPQGNMAGHGVSVGQGITGRYNVEEHGYIIGILSIMPKPAYMQGIPKTFLKRDPLEWYWPSFANIGEQEVKVSELFAYTPDGEDTFGYIPRYAEYKYMPNRVAGDFRTTLNYWHLGRIFATQPDLEQQFIECDPDEVNRIFAVTDPDVDNLYIHVLNKVKAVRPMPVFGTPMI